MTTTPTTTLLLAPMEGLLDFVLRDVLTRVGGEGAALLVEPF